MERRNKDKGKIYGKRKKREKGKTKGRQKDKCKWKNNSIEKRKKEAGNIEGKTKMNAKRHIGEVRVTGIEKDRARDWERHT